MAGRRARAPLRAGRGGRGAARWATRGRRVREAPRALDEAGVWEEVDALRRPGPTRPGLYGGGADPGVGRSRRQHRRRPLAGGSAEGQSRGRRRVAPPAPAARPRWTGHRRLRAAGPRRPARVEAALAAALRRTGSTPRWRAGPRSATSSCSAGGSAGRSDQRQERISRHHHVAWRPRQDCAKSTFSTLIAPGFPQCRAWGIYDLQSSWENRMAKKSSNGGRLACAMANGVLFTNRPAASEPVRRVVARTFRERDLQLERFEPTCGSNLGRPR